GTVDEYDGFFQRLRADPGEHEIEIYREGYHSVRQKIYLSPGTTLRVQYDMVRLQPGEPVDPRPMPRTAPPPPPNEPPRGPGRRDRERERARDARPADGFGSIAIRVQPA